MLTHPKKQQNTTLLFNAMRTTAAHSFRTFHESEAAAATSAAAPSEAGAAPEGQRSSATPAPPPITSQSAGSQSSGPSASQDPVKSTVGTAKRKKKRTCVPWTRMAPPLIKWMGRGVSCHTSTSVTLTHLMPIRKKDAFDWQHPLTEGLLRSNEMNIL